MVIAGASLPYWLLVGLTPGGSSLNNLDLISVLSIPEDSFDVVLVGSDIIDVVHCAISTDEGAKSYVCII
jgi:hypothetical protein